MEAIKNTNGQISGVVDMPKKPIRGPKNINTEEEKQSSFNERSSIFNKSIKEKYEIIEPTNKPIMVSNRDTVGSQASSSAKI